MITLFLDLACKEQRMDVVNETCVLAGSPITDHRDETILLKTLDRLLSDALLTRKDLYRLACVTGPGGFTTVRVGVAMMNALAYVLGIPITGIHGSDLSAARTTKKNFVWLHSTRKAQLFVRGFGIYKEMWPEATLIDIDALTKELCATGCVFIGELIEEHMRKLQPLNPQRANSQPINDILPAFLSSQIYKPGIIEPWYGRGI